MIDLEQAKLFLSTLGAPPYIFQTFTDSKEQRKLSVKDPLARVLVGTFEEHIVSLQTLSSKGAGIFVQINAGRERGKAAVTQVRALFVDLDHPDRADATLAVISKNMPKPSMLVSSSPGKYHLYWLVNNCSLTKFGLYQKHLTIRFFTDDSMGNLDRVMRIPGFPHQKKSQFQVTLKTYNIKYKIKDLEEYMTKLPSDLLSPYDIPKPPTIPLPPQAKTTDNPFGIDINEDYEAPTVLAPGERTSKLIRHIGWMVQQGYDEAKIRCDIVKMNSDLCPENAAPIPPNILEGEVFGCVEKFIKKRDQEIRSIHGEVFVKATSVADIIPPAPPPPAVAELMGEPEPPTDTLTAWLERFIYIVDKKRVADSAVSGEWAIMTWEEFEKQHVGKKASKSMKLTTAWLCARERLTARGVSYKPTYEPIITDSSNQKFFNSYQPSDVVPAYKYDINKIGAFLEHIIYLFPKDDDRESFLGWFCYTITQPLKTVTWAPVLVSKQGSGKGWILEVMKKLMGETNVKPITPDRIENQFNSFLFNSTLVCLFDMYKSKNRQLDGKLKGYIDVEQAEANKKNAAERTEKVWANFLIFANADDDVYVEPGDRRFWLVELPDPRSPEYYNRIFAWLEEDENMPHLLSWCTEYKSKKFSPTHPPGSSLKIDVMNRNKSEIQLELETCIEERLGPFACNVMTFDTVRLYMETALSMEIKGAQRSMLSKVWGSISSPIKIERVAIVVGSSKTRQRIRCIRDVNKWSIADKYTLSDEASRALLIVMNPIQARADLKAVERKRGGKKK